MAQRTFVFEIYRNGRLLRKQRVKRDSIKIGRHLRSHICLEDASVGRVHALIEVTNSQIFLTDLGSGRGTLLNGSRVSKAEIHHKDKIKLGNIEVVFNTRDEEAETAAKLAHEKAMAAAIAARKKYIKDDTVYSRRFLSKPASSDGSLEIAILYRDFVMMDEIFKPPRNLTIGAENINDFLIEHQGLGSSFTLIDAVNENPDIFFLPENMQGEIYIDTQKFSLEEAISSGKASSIGKKAKFTLTKNTRVKLIIGDFVIFIHRSTHPKLILPINWSNNSMFLYIGLSLLMHALFLMLVFLMRPEMAGQNMDSFDANDRFVQLLMPEEEEEEPPPEENPFEEEEDEGEEAAEREAGDEGNAGDENEEENDSRMAVEGDNDSSQPTELALRQATEEASTRGVVGVMNNFGPSSLFGSEASGYDDMMAIGGVGGQAVGASYGTGGLGRYGGGLSGGGTRSGGGFGGGPIAVGGRSSGDGNLGRSEAAHVSRDRERREVAVVPGTPEIRGQLDRDIIARVIREHRREVRSCYENELQRNPDLAGRIIVRFVISPDGAVASSDVQESDLGNNAVESCIVRRVRRWRFPEPRGGGIVRVSYPFVFTAG